jgi:hypothetical protein
VHAAELAADIRELKQCAHGYPSEPAATWDG